jgi:predicted phage-related endonuclease
MPRIIEGQQYADLWWRERRGKITASEMGCILTPKTMKLSATADTYMYRIIGDLFDTEYPRKDENTSAAVRRGTMMEPESRRYYELLRDVKVRQVSMVVSDCGRLAASPDGLVGEDGVIECKNPMPHTMAKWVCEGALPDDHKAQCHGLLIVTGRAWVDWLAYCPGFPPLLIRVTPDEYTSALALALDRFAELLAAAVEKIRSA